MPIRENQLKDFVAVFIIFNISFIVQSKTYIFLLSRWKIGFQKAAIAYTLMCMTLEGIKSFKKSLLLQHAHFYYVFQLLIIGQLGN